MVVLRKPAVLPQKSSSVFSGIPVVNISEPGSEALLVRACEELGFFKVTNHGVPLKLIEKLEEEVIRFFALPETDKERVGPANPLGYGNRRIGGNGDIGWVEYLLMKVTFKPMSHASLPALVMEPCASSFLSALNEYVLAVKKLACVVLELMAQGLQIEPRNVLSDLVMDEESDSILRLNHYPPCPMLQGCNNTAMTGFGEHTDPQIISVLRSNNTSGLEISLRDGSWVSVPGYPLTKNPSSSTLVIPYRQVLTNGRFRSVRHRVLANSFKSRVSMIFFGGPPPGKRLAPLPLLMEEGEQSLYKEFTWCEFKSCASNTTLADDRLGQFKK